VSLNPNPAVFLEGREAYLAKIPLYQIAARIDELSDISDKSQEAFLYGFFDGALADLRDCAQNAREEIAARPRTLKLD
jgi:hypothetical protein